MESTCTSKVLFSIHFAYQSKPKAIETDLYRNLNKIKIIFECLLYIVFSVIILKIAVASFPPISLYKFWFYFVTKETMASWV